MVFWRRECHRRTTGLSPSADAPASAHPAFPTRNPAGLVLPGLILLLGSAVGARAQDDLAPIRATYTQALQLEQQGQAGEVERFEEARGLFLQAAEQAQAVAAGRPLDGQALAASALRMNCLLHVGLEVERRQELDALLEALPGQLTAEEALPGLQAIARDWVGDVRYRVPMLVRTGEAITYVRPPPRAFDFSAATDALQRFVDLYPQSDQAPQALLTSQEVQLYDGHDVEAAAAIHDRLVQEYPQSPAAVRSDYLFGIAGFHLGDRQASVEALKRVAAAAPDSSDGRVAAALVRAVDPKLARPHETLRWSFQGDLDRRAVMGLLADELSRMLRRGGDAGPNAGAP